jgi:hypothetical protein
LSILRFEEIVTNSLQFVALELTCDVTIDYLVYNKIELLRILRFRQEPNLDLFLSLFTKLTENV